MGKWMVAAAAICLASCAPPAQHPRQQIDPQLRAEIWNTKAIDNHAHPMREFGANDPDHEFDALPVEAMEEAPMAIRLDPSNPEYRAEKSIRERGDGYPIRVLDRLHIDIMLANRVAMGRGLPANRFRWVPFADALIFPLNNESLGKRDPDRKNFFAAETKLLQRYLSESGQPALPGSLGGYLRFVTSVLERQRSQGAIAEKFEVAYLRALDFGNPAKADAERVYARGGVPSDADYKTLQDYLFRYVAAECGRLGMPVHVHSCAGAGSYFDVAGANPLLMEPLFDDPALRKTKFVLIHGGWPFIDGTTALLTKPNVWADYSLQTLLVQPRELSETLRRWLEFMPNKVLFGTDASPITAEVGWEESGWLSAESGRDALGMALTAMLRDQEIDRQRASQLAQMVLRDNARQLYGWK